MRRIEFLLLATCIVSLCSSCENFVDDPFEKLRVGFKNINHPHFGFYIEKEVTVTIPLGTTLDELGKAAYSDLQKYYDDYGMGAVKLCYEISADINGMYNSNQIIAGNPITFYSIGSLGFKFKKLGDDEDNLPAHIINNHLEFLGGNVKHFWERRSFSGIEFTITVRNLENYPINVDIFKGDLFETTNPNTNPQNIVVANDVNTTIDANSSGKIELTGYCTNKNKTIFGGEPVRPTPLYMDSMHCDSQELVWEYFDKFRIQHQLTAK